MIKQSELEILNLKTIIEQQKTTIFQLVEKNQRP